MSIKRTILRAKVKAKRRKEEKEKRELAQLKRQERKALAKAKSATILAEQRAKTRAIKEKNIGSKNKNTKVKIEKTAKTLNSIYKVLKKI
jgi:regulator of protease activity HflC (stomatin/prohibitin superfamily)